MDSDKTSGSTFMEKYLTPIAVLVGAAIIGAAFIFGHGAAAPTQQQGQPQAVKVDIKNVKTDGDPFVGNANAPVTMAIWFDYQCPFCKQLDTNVMPQLYEQYVKTGKVKVVFKDFQFLGNDSMTDAEFARAVWEAYPDHFYEWYEAMFVAQDKEGDQGFGNLDSVVAMTKAKVPAIDTAKVTTLITQNKAKYDSAIAADRAEGATFGINGTPSLIIGTTNLSGAQPLSAITPLIDAQLKK